MAARHAVDTVVLRAGRALDAEDVLALVLLHDLLQMSLERLARSSAQQMVILEVDLAQHEIGRQRRCRADERLITARALMAMDPDHDRQRLHLSCLDDLAHLVR